MEEARRRPAHEQVLDRQVQVLRERGKFEGVVLLSFQTFRTATLFVLWVSSAARGVHGGLVGRRPTAARGFIGVPGVVCSRVSGLLGTTGVGRGGNDVRCGDVGWFRGRKRRFVCKGGSDGVRSSPGEI